MNDKRRSRSVGVESCASRYEAEWLKSLLAANGIKAMIATDDYAGLTLLTHGGVELMVLEEEAERAHEILTEAHARRQAS